MNMPNKNCCSSRGGGCEVKEAPTKHDVPTSMLERECYYYRGNRHGHRVRLDRRWSKE